MNKLKEIGTIAAIIMLVVVNVFYTISVSAGGAEVAKFEDEEIVLIDRNQDLAERIMDKSSLQRAEAEASGAGFLKAANVIYISPSEAVAARPP